jgi:probable F420-dependent oxidoreductase
MEIGVTFPQNGVGGDIGAIREYVQTAEALGYDYIFAGDHVIGGDPVGWDGRAGPYTVDYIYHEPMTLLAYMAAITTRIKLFTGVIILPQRQATLVAKQAAEIDYLSGGRLMLGVGVGWNEREYAALNVDFHTRGARMEEQFEVMRALWTQRAPSYEGRWHRIDRSGLNPRPARSIPLWIGGDSDAALRRTGRIADGWIAMNMSGPFDLDPIAEGWGCVQQTARDAGRDPATLGLHVRVIGATADETARNVESARAFGVTHATVGSRELPTAEAQLKAIVDQKAAIG